MNEVQPLPVFQPFIDTATGQISGVEALARIRGSSGRLISAGALFSDPNTPQAALLKLDRNIRQQALIRFQQAPQHWFLSLNISPHWISRLRPNQPLPSLKQIELSGIDPRRIVLEITELNDANNRLPETVLRYRAAGIRIAIDDFGAGHSQIDRVVSLQPDILKLDMRLFKAAALGGTSGEIVRALALMAERTGCWIIAEGVETHTELDFALECGVRYVQGYLFAQPRQRFFANDAFVTSFARQRDRYVQQKLRERTQLIKLRNQLNQLFIQLDTWLSAGCKGTLPTPASYPWLLRLYQCDRHGTQISPNIEWRESGWRTNSNYLGHNWSWRPYFYQILAESWDAHRLVLSNPYRDVTSNQYCLTAGQFIDKGKRLLLVDIDAHLV